MIIRWVPALSFVVPGQPVPKPRPRFARTPTGVRTFSPPKISAYESKVGILAGRLNATGYLAPKGTPVRVDIVAVFKRPQRLQRRADPDGLIAMTARPDIDNIQKAILDALTRAPGNIWVDDDQVQVVRAEKFYAEKGGEPRVEVRIFKPKQEDDR